MTTKVTGSVLANTAVTAGTYGGSTAIPVITVDAQGRLTSAANVASTQVYANTGQLTANTSTGVVAVGLATSGAIAGSYGSGTTTPVISVDAYGRITSVSATTITGGSAGIGATTYNRQSNIATSGQTIFTVTGGYTVGYLQVYLNGVLLNASDYTASNGTSFTLAAGASVGDIVESLAYTVTNVLNVSPSPSGGSAGQVLYQSAANTTANTDVGTAGYLLTSQGTGKPTWSAQTSLVVANTQITGVMTASQLAATAVTPGTYGGASAISVFTVDQQGRLTSAANVAVTTGSTSNVQTFLTTGTWYKPSGVSMARIQLWGGGGGAGRSNGTGAGHNSGGGGGGGYNEITVPVSYLAATVTATVGGAGTTGALGVAGGAGGTSSFALATAVNGRSTIYAYGGGGGGTLGAGGGGGTLGAGSGGSGGSGGAGATAGATAYFNGNNASNRAGFDNGGGPAFITSTGGCTPIYYGYPGGSGFWGGGGGGVGAVCGAAGCLYQRQVGGGSVYGGGGGSATGGTSLYGGAGGSSAAGTQPGGGGGMPNNNSASYAGAAGQIIVTCW